MTTLLPPTRLPLTPAARLAESVARLDAQLHALDGWLQSLAELDRQAGDVLTGTGLTREARLDRDRAGAARRQQRQALHSRAADKQRQDRPLLELFARPRAVLVHRHPWVLTRVANELASQQVDVVASLDDGTDAMAAVLLEQPDVLFVEALLPGVTGLDLTRQVRALLPHLPIAVQVGQGHPHDQAHRAGADRVFSRSTAPEDVARQLAALVIPGPPAPAVIDLTDTPARPERRATTVH